MEVKELSRVSVKRTYTAVADAAWKLAHVRFDQAAYQALIVCCDGLGPLVVFRNGSLPTMNLCFTPLRAVYDADYRERLLRQGGAHAFKLVAEIMFRAIDRRAWRRFDSVICNSLTTRDRVLAGGLRRADEMMVAYPGVAETSIRGQTPLGDFYFLPGRIMWTKNIELAIEALRLYRAAGGKRRLIIAGMVDRKSESYYKSLVERAADVGGVEFETQVSDARMRALYEGCYGVILSAFNEDQGLTPLEGMACGKPVIAVNRGGPRESVADGETGWLVEPAPDAFAKAMKSLDEDAVMASSMGAAGLERVRAFTWERFVSQVDDELDSIMLSRGREVS